MSVTFGDSFKIRGFLVRARRRLVIAATSLGSVPRAIPPVLNVRAADVDFETVHPLHPFEGFDHLLIVRVEGPGHVDDDGRGDLAQKRHLVGDKGLDAHVGQTDGVEKAGGGLHQAGGGVAHPGFGGHGLGVHRPDAAVIHQTVVFLGVAEGARSQPPPVTTGSGRRPGPSGPSDHLGREYRPLGADADHLAFVGGGDGTTPRRPPPPQAMTSSRLTWQGMPRGKAHSWAARSMGLGPQAQTKASSRSARAGFRESLPSSHGTLGSRRRCRRRGGQPGRGRGGAPGFRGGNRGQAEERTPGRPASSRRTPWDRCRCLRRPGEGGRLGPGRK